MFLAAANSGLLLDWTVFWSTLIATIAGAAVASGLTIWITSRERPAPQWHFAVASGLRSDGDPTYGLVDIEVTNVGNGTAHSVGVSFKRAVPAGPTIFIPILAPGKKLTTSFAVRRLGNWDVMPKDDEKSLDWPDDGFVVLTWRQIPRLKHAKSEQFPLAMNARRQSKRRRLLKAR